MGMPARISNHVLCRRQCRCCLIVHFGMSFEIGLNRELSMTVRPVANVWFFASVCTQSIGKMSTCIAKIENRLHSRVYMWILRLLGRLNVFPQKSQPYLGPTPGAPDVSRLTSSAVRTTPWGMPSDAVASRLLVDNDARRPLMSGKGSVDC